MVGRGISRSCSALRVRPLNWLAHANNKDIHIYRIVNNLRCSVECESLRALPSLSVGGVVVASPSDARLGRSPPCPRRRWKVCVFGSLVSVWRWHRQHRARMGRPPVRINSDMCLAAQRHATNMADTGWYRHSGLPWPEIIYAGPRSEQDAVNGWINSPAHHGIMLSGSEVGFGYMVRNGQPYWVGLFR
ncbi:MAG: hypothetical protein B7Z55_19210 [Planctomycetales bacterium 12-60-4]|nr:MAG: hypothetical protein B7Z55_19210 [Planctomycetales bacterium 12-60-4]